MIRRGGIVLLMVCALLLALGCAKKTPALNLLVWEGYADPSFVRGFEEQYHCKVSASYMGSSDELVAKLRGGSAGNYDVISPSSDVATSIASAGLAAPLDLSKLPTYSQLSPQLTSLPLVRVKGQVFGVPFMWGPDPLIYDTPLSRSLRIAGMSSGTRNTAARFRCGMIFPRYTWRRRCRASTNPIPASFIT